MPDRVIDSITGSYTYGSKFGWDSTEWFHGTYVNDSLVRVIDSVTKPLPDSVHQMLYHINEAGELVFGVAPDPALPMTIIGLGLMALSTFGILLYIVIKYG